MLAAITIGEGRARPQGAAVTFPPGVLGLATVLRARPSRLEAWWSPHSWVRAYRLADEWTASCAVAVDVDYVVPDESPPPELVVRVVEEARAGKLPGSIFHLTPHGFRVVFVFDAPVTDKRTQIQAEKAAGAKLSAVLAALDLFTYRVDEPLLGDLARFFYTPNCIAKGVQRDAEIIVMATSDYDASALALEAPPEAAPVPRVATPRTASTSFEQAVARWNADHRQSWPKSGGECPACGHDGCFGTLPDSDGERWFCFSTNHTDGVGVRGPTGYHGDALDIEAHARGLKHAELLRDDGYLAPRRERAPVSTPPDEPDPDTSVSDLTARALRSRSYYTAVQIIRDNKRNVLEGRVLECNELTGRAELGRRYIKKEDLSRVRGLIEARFTGGIDKDGMTVGLQLSAADIQSACHEVAIERSYHPVRDYLEHLPPWDRTPRLDHVPDEQLGAQRTPLNSAMFRRFAISAVARAMRPGCKVDTVLVFVGPQGCGKSTLFRALAGEWFVDSAVDIHNKDSYAVLRGAWIYEWAELEVLRRARDAGAVKAFLTSAVDTYRPSHEPLVVDVPRSCVIVGSTNDDEFLADSTGSRRFWPLTVGQIDLERLIEIRDQLWAEAVHLYRAGERWWLTAEEEAWIVGVHDKHAVSDAWEDLIIPWAEGRVVAFSTADVLEDALRKPKGQWEKPDQMRVASILKRAGFKRAGLHRRSPWVPK